MGCNIKAALAWLDEQAEPCSPQTVIEAWLNHFDAFAGQDLDRIMSDYDYKGVPRAVDDVLFADWFEDLSGQSSKRPSQSLRTEWGRLGCRSKLDVAVEKSIEALTRSDGGTHWRCQD